jgi:hypothetical protein
MKSLSADNSGIDILIDFHNIQAMDARFLFRPYQSKTHRPVGRLTEPTV